jgi:hypothetical protein
VIAWCEWCSDAIHFDDDARYWPDDVPSHIPVDVGDDRMAYHRWCWESVIEEEESQWQSR